MYQRIIIATSSRDGEPGPLPELIDGLTDHDLADLSFLPVAHNLNGIGYWPVVTADPDFDPNTQVPDDPVSLTVDTATKTVKAAHTIRSLTADELAPRRQSLKDAVMAKKDVEIDGDITFNGVVFQTRSDDRENIAGAAQLAFMAIVGGAQPGNLRWNGGSVDFSWIAKDNSLVTMDAQTMVAFAKATAERKSDCIFRAFELKASIDAAADLSTIDINSGWPD